MKTRQVRAGGIHSKYIIDLLDRCKSTTQYCQLQLTSKMTFKKTFLNMLAWAVDTELLKNTRRGWYSYYTTTQKGRDFLKTLEKL